MGQIINHYYYYVLSIYHLTCYYTTVIYLLQLLSSWGDCYYVGLNGIELFDVANQPVHLTANSMISYSFHTVHQGLLSLPSGDTLRPLKNREGYFSENS